MQIIDQTAFTVTPPAMRKIANRAAAIVHQPEFDASPCQFKPSAGESRIVHQPPRVLPLVVNYSPRSCAASRGLTR